jgi:phosphopantetheine adenylyltransferase
LSGSYRILLENAIETGEVKGLGMTSDEALSELKKCKDKLELGLITQEEFDSKKSELSKFIK